MSKQVSMPGWERLARRLGMDRASIEALRPAFAN
jgi:hypothetical protein